MQHLHKEMLQLDRMQEIVLQLGTIMLLLDMMRVKKLQQELEMLQLVQQLKMIILQPDLTIQ